MVVCNGGAGQKDLGALVDQRADRTQVHERVHAMHEPEDADPADDSPPSLVVSCVPNPRLSESVGCLELEATHGQVGEGDNYHGGPEAVPCDCNPRASQAVQGCLNSSCYSIVSR